MSFSKIINGDFGQVAQLTFIDVDTNEAADISSYTTAQQMIFTSPAGVAATKTAAFADDGTDGVIQYTIEDGLINAAGFWKVRGRVTRPGAKLTTVEHTFLVREKEIINPP